MKKPLERRQENGHDICQICGHRQAVMILSPAVGQSMNDDTPREVAMCPECHLDFFVPTALDYGLVDRLTTVIASWMVNQERSR